MILEIVETKFPLENHNLVKKIVRAIPDKSKIKLATHIKLISQLMEFPKFMEHERSSHIINDLKEQYFKVKKL